MQQNLGLIYAAKPGFILRSKTWVYFMQQNLGLFYAAKPGFILCSRTWVYFMQQNLGLFYAAKPSELGEYFVNILSKVCSSKTVCNLGGGARGLPSRIFGA